MICVLLMKRGVDFGIKFIGLPHVYGPVPLCRIYFRPNATPLTPFSPRFPPENGY